MLVWLLMLLTNATRGGKRCVAGGKEGPDLSVSYPWLAGTGKSRQRNYITVSDGANDVNAKVSAVCPTAGGYLALAGGTMPFMRRYSTIWP